jgi:pre-60S factor REI1
MRRRLAGSAHFATPSLLTPNTHPHSYNLKRKVAGLPPVTREWYDARREALAGGGGGAAGGGGATSASGGGVRVWTDPLTRKRFTSEATYKTFVASNKYGAALKKAGLDAPPGVVVSVVQTCDASTSGRAPSSAPPPPAFRVAAPNGVTFATPATPDELPVEAEEGDGWATASDQEDPEEAPWVAWDPARSLFDNALFPSVEACLEHMWRHYGFYLPDAPYLADPEGLLTYLGEKLANGRVPLYSRGDDESAKSFPSLHAVQRHMVDAGRTKLAWEGNEAEYDEWYDYSAALEGEEGEEGGRAMVVDGASDAPSVTPTGLAAYELALPGSKKLLGSRHLARYYRQKHRPDTERRASATAAAVAAKYKMLGVGGLEDGPGAAVARAKAHKARTRVVRAAMRAEQNANVTRNLPRNVPY